MTDDWINKTWRIYSGIVFSHKKNENFPFAATWVDLEGITLSEISQTEKGKYCITSLVCGISKKKKKLIEKRSDTWLPEAGA